MSDDTWIKLHRKILDSMVFANPDLLKVWIYCMCKATYKSRWTTVKVGRGETEVELHPGQFIFGRKSAGKKLKMNPETVRKRMDKLKKAGNITIESTTQYSIVTVVNFTRYQAKQEKSTIESTSQVPTKYQPSTTNKKG
ncbi:MAG: hypothetical protein GY757_19100 [bacterium]|nr:hypothetical protein [bacterium]